MSNSLEIRSPFLDHDIIEYAFRLDFSNKVNFNQGKVPLRSLLSKYR